MMTFFYARAAPFALLPAWCVYFNEDLIREYPFFLISWAAIMNIKDSGITLTSFLLRPSKRKLIREARKLRNLKGLEIGGPSSLFSIRGYFPVYLFANLDGVNFSTDTVWEGSIKEGHHYRSHRKTGHQFICEATDLGKISNASYDFILSCHSLEHVANPLKALEEWSRVLKPGGKLILVLPDKNHTFDKNRPYTTFDHLLKDYVAGTGESDESHFEEIISCLVPGPHTNANKIREDLSQNALRRVAHHHVFDWELISQMLAHFSFQITFRQTCSPFHLVTIAEKMN